MNDETDKCFSPIGSEIYDCIGVRSRISHCRKGTDGSGCGCCREMEGKRQMHPINRCTHLFADKGIGQGDFEIRARLSLRLNGSAAARRGGE